MLRISVALAIIAFTMGVNAGGSNEVIVLSGSESSDGLTQNDLDINMLAKIEMMIKTKAKEKSLAYMTAHGYKDAKIQVKASSAYLTVEGIKLAIVKLNLASTNQVHVIGIKEGELLRVACIRQTEEPVPISYGKCGDQIRKVFGVNFAGDPK
jgi:hypothetical protein